MNETSITTSNNNHIFIKEIPVQSDGDGFALKSAEKGENVPILFKSFVCSDQKEFYAYIDSISSIFFSLAQYQIEQLSNFLIIVHKDLSADIYINQIPIVLEIKTTKAIKAGSMVTIKDIADINKLYFYNININNDDKVTYCFKKGWKFGLYFDFSRNINLEELYKDLGNAYKYLTFQEEYIFLSNEKMFLRLLTDGWFPFIQLLGGEFKELARHYKIDDIKSAHIINNLVDSFDKTRINTIVERWWINDIFKDKQKIITAGINAYLSNTDDGFVNSIKNLYTEIEGIIHIKFYNEHGRDCSNFKELFDYLEEKAKKKFTSSNSLGFPGEFCRYLNEAIFKYFDLKTGKLDLTRHSIAHGVAKEEDYNKIRALQAILVLDQIYFYLN